MSFSFTAELHSQLGRVGVNSGLLGNSSMVLPWHLAVAREYNGWLRHLAPGQDATDFLPLRFCFTFMGHDFVSQLPHFQISIPDEGNYGHARLEQNKFGWLGLYGGTLPGRVIDALNLFSNAENSTWALQMIKPTGKEAGRFYLSDADGHRVASRPFSDALHPFTRGEFLYAGERDGRVLRFYFLNMRVG